MIWLMSIFLASLPPEDLRRLLEHQYEQRLSGIRQELEASQKQLAACQNSERAALREAQEEIARLQAILDEPVVPQSARPLLVTPESLFELALREVRAENWNEALIQFEDLVRHYPESELADRALFWMGQVYLHRGEPRLARFEFERLLRSYPRSPRAQEARAEIKKLQSSQSSETSR